MKKKRPSNNVKRRASTGRRREQGIEKEKDRGIAKGPGPADSKPGAKKIDKQESGGIKGKATPNTGSKGAKAKPNNKEPQQKE